LNSICHTNDCSSPNSLLNTLFILNQRRSTGLADPVELKLRFGTSVDLIDELKARMLRFVLENKRDYAPKILTEVRTIDELYSITMNFIFFHKSSYQNELVRLQRHDKFAVELMRQIHDLGIQGPRYQQPGATKDWPLYMNSSPPTPHEVYDRPDGGFDRKRSSDHPLKGGNPLIPSYSQRHRSDSRATSVRAFAAVMAAESNPHEFGNVYETRRGEGMARRASIRLPPPTTIQEGYALSGALDRTESHATADGSESLRHRMWGRGRGRSIGMERAPSNIV
jgi:small-conductance mechanosensitive channel